MTAPRSNAAIDQNWNATLMGVSSADGKTPVAVEVDPNTGELLTSGGGSSSSASATTSSVNDSASNATLIAANTARQEVIIANDSSSTLYLKLGTTATTTDYTAKLGTDDIFITSYAGRIDGIWSADSTGAARITELA